MSEAIDRELETKRKHLTILAGFCVGSFFLAGLLTIVLLVLIWRLETVWCAVALGLWAIAWLLKFIVKDKEEGLKALEERSKSKKKGGKAVS